MPSVLPVVVAVLLYHRKFALTPWMLLIEVVVVLGHVGLDDRCWVGV